jgi:hypothetical protein
MKRLIMNRQRARRSLQANLLLTAASDGSEEKSQQASVITELSNRCLLVTDK